MADWIIAPLEADSPVFDDVWAWDFENNWISLGWRPLGDVSHLSQKQIEKHAQRLSAADRLNRSPNYLASIFWRFYHKIDRDDRVIARRGQSILLARGRVIEPAIYDSSPRRVCRCPIAAHTHDNWLRVEWDREEPRDRVLPDQPSISEFYAATPKDGTTAWLRMH